MENVVIEQLIAQSVFAGLFVWLLIDTRKDNKAREQKYQDTIKELSIVLHDVVKEVKDDVADIKNKLEKKG